MRAYAKYKLTIFVLVVIVAVQALILLTLIERKRNNVARKVAALKGKIAIVLDDWGYNLNDVRLVEEIGYPLTLSILPNLAYSSDVASFCRNSRCEAILHQPMEPHRKSALEKNTIMTSMDESRIVSIIDDNIVTMPYVKGVSNHMGSRATEDPRTMSLILGQLKKRNLYYLDSLVTADSVCSQVAENLHMKFAKRDIFLDNQNDPGYIRNQLYKLASIASKEGSAVGIGHDRVTTLQVLQEVMPQLAEQGYRFVLLSELVR